MGGAVDDFVASVKLEGAAFGEHLLQLLSAALHPRLRSGERDAYSIGEFLLRFNQPSDREAFSKDLHAHPDKLLRQRLHRLPGGYELSVLRIVHELQVVCYRIARYTAAPGSYNDRDYTNLR